MNFLQYEQAYYRTYEQFAEVVRDILSKSIGIGEGVSRPQAIQARAKTPASLRKRLANPDDPACDVSTLRRDLAGVRLIFYTNNDVDRFVGSSILFDNFEIETGSTKVHHPAAENDEVRYRAVHYTVSLNAARLALPEYAGFAGLRCEVQIQTVLIHAWAETSHDIIYKMDEREGFGNEATGQIRKRFNRIMDEYLVPAGYQFQRVQQDYERLLAGKMLFDQNLVESLKAAQDNNERHQIVSALADDLLPLYDDIPSIFSEVLDALVETVEVARTTPTQQIETAFSPLEGRTATDVALRSLEIISKYQYAAVEPAFLALLRLFSAEEDEKVRKRILEIVSNLFGYNLSAWKQVGPDIQIRLATVLRRIEPVAAARPLMIEAWGRILDSEATGFAWGAGTATFSSGDVPIGQITELRDNAIDALFEFFRTSQSDEERREVFFEMDNVKRETRSGSSDWLRQRMADHARIVTFVTTQTDILSYELRETIEATVLHDYHGVLPLLGTDGAARGCLREAEQLAAAIRGLKDSFNADPIFVRYKILVGYEGVIPDQWENPDYDPEGTETYRDQRITEYLDEVSDTTKSEWLLFLQRCAATRSDDLATFPKFGSFLFQLSETKPEIAEWLLENGNDDLLRFLPAFLRGLAISSSPGIYRRNLEKFMTAPDHLLSVAIHWQASEPNEPETLRRIIELAIENDDRRTLGVCIVYSIAHSEKAPTKAEGFKPALAHLVAAGDPRWLRQAWMPKRPIFFDSIDADDAALLTAGMVELPRIAHDAERILSYFPDQHLGIIWDLLENRMNHPREMIDGTHYEAVPHRLKSLAVRLASDVDLAIARVRDWFHRDDKDSRLFGYRGGRVLHNVFSTCPPEFGNRLIEIVREGDRDGARFVVGVLQNYHREASTHSVLQALITVFGDDDAISHGVRRSIRNTGVMQGEYGHVDTLRDKKNILEPWLLDDNPAVAQFAQQFISDLEVDILDAQRRADNRVAMRKLEYEDFEIDDI